VTCSPKKSPLKNRGSSKKFIEKKDTKHDIKKTCDNWNKKQGPSQDKNKDANQDRDAS
jgi:hypothetical protein